MTTLAHSAFLAAVCLALLSVLLSSSPVSGAPSALWQHVGRASDSSMPMRLTVGVRQRNVGTLEKLLLAVSSPSSPSYRRHLSFAEVNALMAPPQSSIAAVEQWLVDGGVERSAIRRTVSGDWLSADTTLGVAEALLQAEYSTYRHVERGVEVTRTERYTVPDSVRPHIDVIGPTTRFPAYHTPHSMLLPDLSSVPHLAGRSSSVYSESAEESLLAPSADICANGTSPTCIRAAYGIGDASASSGMSTGAVTGFYGESISLKDLDQFHAQFDPTQVGRRPPIIRGPNNETEPTVEASLDIQYLSAMAHGANVTFWSTPGRQPKNPENEPFLDWLMAMANTTVPPYVVSSSYGDDEPGVDPAYADRCNTEFAKAGARGVSLLFSSGDGGVGGGRRGCIAFVPTWPAASPFVTAVGATRIITGSPLNETAATFSGGGFSDYAKSPDWQQGAVAAYLTTLGKNLPDAKYYNRTGRAFPDVSAVGEAFPVIVEGRVHSVGGTSASSPTFAGLIIVANDMLLSGGQPTLGFLNPLIYQYGMQGFNDVTTGNNPGCGTQGFYASPGWDPVTGWGTPDWTAWRAIVQRMIDA